MTDPGNQTPIRRFQFGFQSLLLGVGVIAFYFAVCVQTGNVFVPARLILHALVAVIGVRTIIDWIWNQTSYGHAGYRLFVVVARLASCLALAWHAWWMVANEVMLNRATVFDRMAYFGVANFSFAISCFASLARIPERYVRGESFRHLSFKKLSSQILAGCVIVTLLTTAIQMRFFAILSALKIGQASPSPVRRFGGPGQSMELVLYTIVGESSDWMILAFGIMLWGSCLQLRAGLAGQSVNSFGIVLFWLGFVAIVVEHVYLIDIAPEFLKEIIGEGGFVAGHFLIPLVLSAGIVAWRFAYQASEQGDIQRPISGTSPVVGILLITTYMVVDFIDFCLSASGNIRMPLRQMQVALPEYLVNGSIGLLAVLAFFVVAWDRTRRPADRAVTTENEKVFLFSLTRFWINFGVLCCLLPAGIFCLSRWIMALVCHAKWLDGLSSLMDVFERNIAAVSGALLLLLALYIVSLFVSRRTLYAVAQNTWTRIKRR